MPNDIGLLTSALLTSGDRGQRPGLHSWITDHAASNFVPASREATLDAARRGRAPRSSTNLSASPSPDRTRLPRSPNYVSAVRAAVDLGGDTDTVAAVTGGLAGAVYGVGAIPARWTGSLHVPVPGWGDRVLRCADLVALAEALASAGY